EPATSPPPSTRSNSRMPSGTRATALTSTLASGRGAATPLPGSIQRERGVAALVAAAPALPPAEAGASAAVFHAPHAGQRPNQRDCSLPHAPQKKWVLFALAIDFPE